MNNFDVWQARDLEAVLRQRGGSRRIAGRSRPAHHDCLVELFAALTPITTGLIQTAMEFMRCPGLAGVGECPRP